MKHLLLVLLILPAIAYTDEEPIMSYGSPEVSARTRRIADDFKRETESGRLRQKTNYALNAIIHLAAYKLKRNGNKAEAEKLLKEWKNQYSHYLEDRNLGDHKPLSDWLAQQYQIWVFLLSLDVVHVLRLDDLNVINFAIPVCFACIDSVDIVEYELHFVPLASVTAFWGTFWSCVGASWGTGFIWCSPISMGVEYLTKTFVAPKLSSDSWGLFCD